MPTTGAPVAITSSTGFAFPATDGSENARARRPQPMQGTLAERYLREARGYSGFLPSTFGFLPATGEHPPSMIAAFGLTNEPECGVLGIADADVRAVHLTRLAADGLSRIDKIMI